MGVGVDGDLEAELGLLEEWERGLGELEGLIGRRFGRCEPRAHAVSYVKGLLSDVPTRNGWTIAQQSGHQTPDKIQKMLNQGPGQIGRALNCIRFPVAPGCRYHRECPPPTCQLPGPQKRP